MKHNDVKVAVSHFLELVVNGRGDVNKNVEELVVALDMLAWLQHVIEVPDVPIGDNVPDREFEKMRALVGQQYPDFGYYSMPSNPADQNGEAEMISGDAASDLAAIACELYEVAWRFQNTSKEEALAAFADGYRARWRSQLRTLQWYIERRREDLA